MIALRRNILLFHQAALGDFVLTWPMAMAAARLWPTNRVIYVTAKSKGELAERAIGVEWRDGDGWHGLFTPDVDPASLPPAATRTLAGAALILSFVSDGSDTWAQNVKRIVPEAQLICICARPADDLDRHLTVFHAEQLGEKVDLQGAVSQMLRHTAASGAVPRRSAGDRIIIHPGSGGAAKRWPAEKFAAVGQALVDAGHPVSFILGEAEREAISADHVAAFRSIGKVIEPATLVALFDSLQQAALYLGNDSGPTHLAALLGLPTLALFGRDNDVAWRPLGPGVRIIKRVPLESIAVEEVLAAATELLAGASAVEATVVDED